jgi:urea transport system ATP-binding protein
MSAVLELRDLSVSFDGFQALSGVDLTVEEGELRFLIGPNGAGKTTLVDCITGLTKPTSGEITFRGRSIRGMKEHKIVRLGIGRSFQTPTVFEALTVVENLDLAATFRRRTLSLFRQRTSVLPEVSRTLERIGLAAQAESSAKQLSHGQKQWLEIGMLLVQGPDLLLLDEPVAGMSPQERLDTGELLQQLAVDHTVVVIEHDMAFLRRFARRVTVLHEGKILAEGSVQEMQSDPRVREVYLGRSRDERSGAIVEDATTEPDELETVTQ